MTPTFRLERAADHDEVQRVVAEAFGDGERVHELLADLRRSDIWLGLSFVAEDEDGSIAGHVSFTRAWVDDLREVVEVLVLSPLSVRPDRQRQGVGRALVEGSLAHLQDRPEPVIFLEGDPAYYSRFGFVAGITRGFTRPSVRIPEPGFQVHPLPAYDAWSPPPSGALVYPGVWWRHDKVGLR